MDVNKLSSAEGDQHGLHPVCIFLAAVLLPTQGEEGGEQASGGTVLLGGAHLIMDPLYLSGLRPDTFLM